MPLKANASCRHHIPRQRHRVRNWAEYDAGLWARGSLTVWFTPEAVERWRAETRTTPGGQRLYSDLAITTALTLRALFRLPLRQTEGLVGSIIHLLGVELAVPDHSTISRRAKVVRLPVVPASSGAVDLLVDSTGVKKSLHGVAQRAGVVGLVGSRVRGAIPPLWASSGPHWQPSQWATRPADLHSQARHRGDHGHGADRRAASP